MFCAEVLSTNIRTDPGIQGVKLNDNIVHKETTYADDMTIFTNSLESTKNLLKLITKYESATNAKINKDKTLCLWLGKWKDRNDQLLGLKWSSSAEKILEYL